MHSSLMLASHAALKKRLTPDDSNLFCAPEAEDLLSPPQPSARIVSCHVSTKQSPHFNAFSVARSINAPIVKTSQQALQADGVTPLVVVGETHLTLSRAAKHLTLDALVLDDLDVDILAGIPFMITNDISVRPVKGQVLIEGSEVITYNSEATTNPHAHAVQRTQSYVLRSSSPSTVVLPGEYLELDVPSDLGLDCTLAIEARTDTPSNKCCKVSQLWPQPLVAEAVANKV